MKINKTTFVQAIALVLIITITRLVLNLPQVIILSCSSSSLLNIIYISIIAFVFILIITKLFKNFGNSDIIDISDFVGGKFLKILIGILLIAYLIFVAGNLIRDFSEVIQILYYNKAQVLYLLAFFIIVCIIANLIGEGAVVKSNVIFVSIMIISLLITFITIIPNITIQRTLPILGYGAKETFVSGLSNIFSFSGLFVIFLLPPMLSEKKDFKKISIISTILIAVLLLLTVASLLLSLSFSADIEKISPVYSLISNNEFGRFLQHPESLFVLTWILAFMTYLNVTCMFIIRILKKITNVKNAKPFAIPVGIAVLIMAIIPKSLLQARQLGILAYKYFSTPALFVIFPLILILANIKYKKIHSNKNTMQDENTLD